MRHTSFDFDVITGPASTRLAPRPPGKSQAVPAEPDPSASGRSQTGATQASPHESAASSQAEGS